MAAPPGDSSTFAPSTVVPSPADPLAGVALDPSKPIPTGDDEVEYAPWPTDQEESEKRRRAVDALEHLPLLSDAMSRGELSYSCLRALTRVATPENEERLVDLALVVPASDLERLVREWKKCQRTEEELRADEEARHQGRELWLRPAADGSWRLHGRLDPEVGAALQKALEAAEEELCRTRTEEGPAEKEGAAEAEVQEEPVPRRRRWADALGLVAEGALGEGLGGEEGGPVGRAERFQVVVRVTGETLRGEPLSVGDEPPEVEGGPHLTPETARRRPCAGRWRTGTERAGSRAAGPGTAMPTTSTTGPGAEPRLSTTWRWSGSGGRAGTSRRRTSGAQAPHRPALGGLLRTLAPGRLPLDSPPLNGSGINRRSPMTFPRRRLR